MSQKLINCLYSHFKNYPNDNSQRSKKLKIVCDWDEVIQSLEPKVYYELSEREGAYYDAPWWKPNGTKFEEFFSHFWLTPPIYYSNYGSHSIYTDKSMVKSCLTECGEKSVRHSLGIRSIKDKIDKIKNEPNFYQQAPFLTIAKELLKLIKEDKIEKLIFLSAYDKRKFPNGDPRKKQIFKETFGRFAGCELELIGFENEQQGASKADWVKKNASGFDVVIDDNPNICKKITEDIPLIIVCAPYYPSVRDKHAERVLLVKTSIADLQKEDYQK